MRNQRDRSRRWFLCTSSIYSTFRTKTTRKLHEPSPNHIPAARASPHAHERDAPDLRHLWNSTTCQRGPRGRDLSKSPGSKTLLEQNLSYPGSVWGSMGAAGLCQACQHPRRNHQTNLTSPHCCLCRLPGHDEPAYWPLCAPQCTT